MNYKSLNRLEKMVKKADALEEKRRRITCKIKELFYDSIFEETLNPEQQLYELDMLFRHLSSTGTGFLRKEVAEALSKMREPVYKG